MPWELLADSRGPLFRQEVTIRRQLETACKPIEYRVGLPLRILLVVSRPGDLGFIDPRLSTHSMLDALAPLGGYVRVDFCRPPTLARLEELLRQARRRREPYAIVHFDGHGTFLPEIELGALCFEKPAGDTVLATAKTDYVRADRLGELLAAYEIPLVVLEACRTGTIGKLAVFRSVAPRLIEAGVGSVISMSHAVHVEAARVLLQRFYEELVTGVTLGQTLEQGRAALIAQPYRWIESGPGGRNVELKDWYLPHLYQRGQDLALVPASAVPAGGHPAALAEPEYEFDAFLSYTHADAQRVTAIHSRLTEQHGLRVFLDEKEIGPGPLHEQCREGLRRSRFLLIACSRRSLGSDWVLAEHDMARARDPRGQTIIPLVLDDVGLPLELKALLWRDFRDPAQDAQNAEQLAGQIRTARGRASGGDAAAVAGRFRLASRERSQVGAFPPEPVYGFHGRAHELYELERHFRAYRAVLLYAMGGMGKTTLAAEAAVWWTRTGLFPDGACFLSFEQSASAELVIQVLGTYLEGPQFESLPADEQRCRARDLFQQKQVLLVWDNFESVLPQFSEGGGLRAEGGEPETDAAGNADANQRFSGRVSVSSGPQPSALSSLPSYSPDERDRLVELFRDWTGDAKGKGRLLITCRPAEAGLAGSRQTELQGLARPDSLWLLVRVLETAGIDLNDPRLERDKLNKLLDMLADHPLSIELVGPHLKTLTPDEIMADFGRLLEEFKRGPGVQRNESLLASLAFSTRRLSGAAQAALPWLGLFSGGVFEDVLLDVMGESSPLAPRAEKPLAEREAHISWDVVRAELEATALIRVERDILFGNRPYLRFHPTLPYAAVGRSVPDPAVTRKRFVEVYDSVDTAVSQALYGSNPRGGLQVLAREEANFRTAVRWAVEDQQYAVASAMGDTFRDYLQRSGRLRERDAWVTWLVGEVRKGGFSEALADRERDEAWTLFTQGQAREAIRRLEDLIARLRGATDFDPAFQLAWTQARLGRVLNASGLSEQAIPVLEEAVRQWEALVKVALSLRERASGSRSEPTTIRKAEAERGNLSMALGELANAFMSAGRLDEAFAASERCLEINRELGHDREVAAGLGQSAQVLMMQGRHAEADARYNAAIAAARRAGDKELEGSWLQHQGSLADDMRQYLRAASLYERALKLFQEMNAEGAVMRTCNLLGVVERKQGRLPEARSWYERSREIAKRLGNVVSLASAAQNIGIVCQLEGKAARKQGREPEARQRFEEAKQSIQEAVGLMRRLDNKPYEAMTLGQLAQVHLLLGELDEAERHARQCLEIDERLDITRELPSDYAVLANIAHARGDAGQAAEWERKHDAVEAELQGRSRGPGGLPPQFLQTIQRLAIACAQAAVEGAELDPGAEAALAQIEKLPPPLPDLATFLRQLATGHVSPVPTTLPAEVQDFLTQLLTALREAQGGT
ncbi:MAG: tetratricopeptide repeat protein [Planctomycetota bacterium]|nr:tetratricopeptide repeat protein [Planctomycetota bacterium]